MKGQRSEIEKDLKKLPPQFTVDEINGMYEAIIKDIVRLKKQRVPHVDMERQLHAKHKKLSYGLPGMFFKIVRGELNQTMFRKVMEIKQAVDSGSITEGDARKAVIDAAKAQVEENPNRPRKEAPAGSTVQEITMKARVEDDEP